MTVYSRRTFSEGTPLSYLGRQGRVRPGERVSEQLFEGCDYVAIIVPESLKRLDTGVSRENRALGESLWYEPTQVSHSK